MDENTVRNGMVTADGEALIKEWVLAKKRVSECEREAIRATNDESAARKKLGAWILPSDAVDMEKIGIWYGDSLITAQKIGSSVTVSIRTKGRSIQEI